MNPASNEKSNIVLIGLSGTGKTVVAKYIAQVTGRNLIDTDEIIESNSGYSISEIFPLFGETYFRKLESAVIDEISASKNSVIACGGGVVLTQSNIESLGTNGVFFCLHADSEVRLHRLLKSETRPLLKRLTLEQLQEQRTERMHLYDFAEYHIDTSRRSINDIGDEIIQRMKTKAK